MKVLLTGASGFIGSHILEHLLTNTDWNIVCIASWKHKGLPERVEEVLSANLGWCERVTVITHDLESPIPFRTMERIGVVDYIINCASESHVERSIETPVQFIQNNVNVVINMLELARHQVQYLKAFLQVSTDEVYGPAPEGVNYKEWSSIVPSNPYSASKASQEAIAISYWRTYGIPLIITNTMNNFGEMQDSEKYIAKAIRCMAKDEWLTIHGTLNPFKFGSRYYLHARNHADAILFLLKNTTPTEYKEGVFYPDRYNVVGDIELDNYEVAMRIQKIIGGTIKYRVEDFHKTRPGHDRRYALDGSKLNALGWVAPLDFETSLKRYVEWTLKHPQWL